MSFGQRLRELRRDLDLSQPELADRVGCSAEMLRKLESGQRRPSRELAARLAEVLELDTSQQSDFVRQARGQAPAATASLPAAVTRLIGREQDVRSLCELLASPEVRLVSLIGPPGVGKTRLALQVAMELQQEFRDGVVFVPLAPIHDAALVVEMIAEAVGARGGGSRALQDALVEYLRARQLLLVLDNFEQVLQARVGIGALLAGAPRVQVVVTSRQPLSIYGEHTYDVPPLGVGAARSSPAEVLFLERARAVRRGYARDLRDQALVSEVCRRLDGLPLAIELAASRARVASPAALLDQLGHSLDVLSSGPADFTSRQRSMRGALDWSYELLSDDERRVFAVLSVFAGGCTIEAAGAVAGAGGTVGAVGTVAAAVDSLADKSLVSVSDVADTARFSMLEVVRQYATEHLDERSDAQLRHARYFAELSDRAADELTGPDQTTWLQRLDADHDNFRAALEWALAADGQACEIAGRLCAGLWRFWRDRGFFHEGRRWLTATLAHQSRISESVRAAALNGAGLLALLQSDYAVAIDLLAASRDLYASLGDTSGLALALSNLGIVEHDTGDMDRAEALFTNSLRLHQAMHDAWGEASALLNLGMIDLDRGAAAPAIERFGQSATLFRRVGETRGLAQALSNLGWATLGTGDYPRATTFLVESLELARALAAARLVANNLNSLALIAWYTREYARSAELFGESLAAFSDLGDKRGLAESLEGLAGLAGAQSRPREAARLLGCASALREAVHAPLLRSDEARHAAAVETARGQLDDAAWRAAWAEGRAMPSEDLVSQILDGRPLNDQPKQLPPKVWEMG